MKKVFVLNLLLVFITGCSTTSPISTEEYISNKVHIDISGCNIIVDNDTHEGFLGDGDYFVKAECLDNSEDIVEQLYSWKKLPLLQDLQIIMYGGKKTGRTYEYKFAKGVGIPKIENGYYLFIDRSSGTNKYSDYHLLNRGPSNFTITFYDLDTNTFYYFEYDS